jgi:hypothetical protein
MNQRLPCGGCAAKSFCTLSRSVRDCFALSRQYNKNESFVEKNTWKFRQTFQELRAVCARRIARRSTTPNPEKSHYYNAEWANDNFRYYIENAN